MAEARPLRPDLPPPARAAAARGSGRSWWRWAVLATTAVAACAAVALLVLPGSGEGGGAGDARAAETLRLAAGNDAGALSRPLQAGEYRYARREREWRVRAAGYVAIQPQVREEWIGADGSGRSRTVPAGPLRFESASDRERWVAAGRPDLGEPPSDRRSGPSGRPFHLGATGLSYEELLELPREPKALYERLSGAAVECGCGIGVDEQTFTLIADMLRDWPVPADLRAALLRAAALVPGIETLDSVDDAAGRSGVGVAWIGEGGRRRVLVFDPGTHALLGDWEGQGGTADVESAIVGSTRERP